jgi:uncharacterized protein
MKDSTKAVLFTAIVLLLAVGFCFIPGIGGFGYMMTPTIAVLLMMLVVTRDGYRKSGWSRLGLHKLGMRSWLYVLIVPVIPLAIGYAIVWAAGLSELSPGQDFEGFSWATFPLLFAFLYVKAVLTQSMGEELGWRGYLLPVMLSSMSKRAAMLLNGVIHGVWHFPLIILTGAYHDGEKLWLILPLTVLSTMFLAPVMGEIRLRSGSVWTSSMMHTTHNLVWLILAVITVDQSEASKYIAGDMSIVVVLFYLGLTLYIWRAKKN